MCQKPDIVEALWLHLYGYTLYQETFKYGVVVRGCEIPYLLSVFIKLAKYCSDNLTKHDCKTSAISLFTFTPLILKSHTGGEPIASQHETNSMWVCTLQQYVHSKSVGRQWRKKQLWLSFLFLHLMLVRVSNKALNIYSHTLWLPVKKHVTYLLLILNNLCPFSTNLDIWTLESLKKFTTIRNNRTLSPLKPNPQKAWACL